MKYHQYKPLDLRGFCVLLFLVIFVCNPGISFSKDLNSSQKAFQNQLGKKSPDSGYFSSDKTKEVAQSNQNRRIEELENKLNTITEELKQLKSQKSLPDSRLDSIEEKLSVLAEEIDNIKQDAVVTEHAYEQVFGAAPAASKVYLQQKRGLSVGGYGELLVGQVRENGDNIIDNQRVVMYFGYKFTDRIIFNSEIEFEHATTGTNQEGQSGSVSVEFALLDFLLYPEVNLRAGLLLAPFGIINEIHEPTTFFGVFRPAVETQIIPTTWRENGAGIFGNFDSQDFGTLNYRAYVMNSFDARGFRASNNRGLRIKGNRALFNDVAFVSRVEYEPVPYIGIGGSIFLGNTGQNQRVNDPGSAFNGDVVDGFFQMYETDSQVQYAGFEGRVLFVYTALANAAEINALNGLTGSNSVGDEQWGYYFVGGYNLLSLANFNSQYLQYFAPFIRWEQYDTQAQVPQGFERNPANDRRELTIGINYKPIPNTVVKIDYQWKDNEADTENNQLNFGLGYVF